MSPDTEHTLDEINRKLQIIIENSYLSKLDLMFSVLLSLTIFGVGLFLHNLALEKNVFLISVIAFFPVVVFTLVGEAYAILYDDVVARFGFWFVLILHSLLLAYFLLFVPTANKTIQML